MTFVPTLQKWCDDLATALTAKIGETFVVKPRGSSLIFEADWDDNGKAILATAIDLDQPAWHFAYKVAAEELAESLWVELGSWADFFLYWIDEIRTDPNAPPELLRN